MKHDVFLKKSEQLLLSSGFKELQERLEVFDPNLWQILGISRKEIFVSQFLAWLLNPSGQHNFGSQFLKDFIVEALRFVQEKQTALSLVKLVVMDLSEAEVTAESWLGKNSRPDIVINDRGNGFLCVIENKVGANEGDGQTQKYYEQSLIRYPAEQYPYRVYIYLSPYQVPPECEHFIALSYQSVLTIIDRLQKKGRITETEKFLLKQFQENLRRSIVMDKETLELAQEIYDTYGPVINFIYEQAEKPETATFDAVWDGKSQFFNIGEVGTTPYSWEDSKKFSFICAGGGKRYRQIMQRFKVGDVIYAYVSGSGYVGIGTVRKPALSFQEATLEDGKTKLVDLQQAGKLLGTYNSSSDKDECDWIVLVNWQKTVDKNQAVRLTPIVPSTASKIYDHRRELIDQVRHDLGISNLG
jgi:predicted transcriptional regulator